MSISSRTTSRFSLSDPILTRDGDPTFGIPAKFRFLDRKRLDDEDIITKVVEFEFVGRPDLLAEDIYRDQDLHWILILFNRVENPLNWPKNGQVIEYPSPSAVAAEI